MILNSFSLSLKKNIPNSLIYKIVRHLILWTPIRNNFIVVKSSLSVRSHDKEKKWINFQIVK